MEDHLLLGRLYRLNNDMLKSENEFKTAVKISARFRRSRHHPGLPLQREGDTNRALEVLNTVPECAPTAKLYSALGYTYEQQKDYKQAIDAYRQAMELDHDNLDAVRGLAQNLMNDNQTDAALEQYKVIVEADPSDAQTYMRMAEIDRRRRQIRSGDGEPEEGRSRSCRIRLKFVQHGGGRRSAGAVRRGCRRSSMTC